MANTGNALGGAASGAAAGTAISPGWGTAIGGVVGGLAGLFSGSNNEDEASALQQQAMQEIASIQVPELQHVIFQKYVQQGVFRPEQENAVTQQASSLSSYSQDPRLKQAQLGALTKLQGLSNGGLQPQDAAMLSQIQRQVDQDANAKDQAVMQDMQQRGMAGSGSELASRLIGDQGSANRMQDQSMQAASQAALRSIQNTQGAASLASQLENQNFGQASQQAAAQDAINRWNAQNSQSVGNTNVQANNAAQQYNLNQSQQISNANADTFNRQQQYNQTLAQQDYENRLRKAQGIYAGDQTMANQQLAQGQRNNNQFSGIMSGIGQGAAAYAGQQNYNSFMNKLFPKNGTQSEDTQAVNNGIQNTDASKGTPYAGDNMNMGNMS